MSATRLTSRAGTRCPVVFLSHGAPQKQKLRSSQ
nr:MAG TPA: hypothetical protein [Caudoviricetes sp.]